MPEDDKFEPDALRFLAETIYGATLRYWAGDRSGLRLQRVAIDLVSGASYRERAWVLRHGTAALAKERPDFRCEYIDAVETVSHAKDWPLVVEYLPEARQFATETQAPRHLAAVAIVEARLHWYTGNRRAGLLQGGELAGDDESYLEHIGHTTLGLWALLAEDVGLSLRLLESSRAALDKQPLPAMLSGRLPQWVLFGALRETRPNEAAVLAYAAFLSSLKARLPETSWLKKFPFDPCENVRDFLEDLQGEWGFQTS